MFRINNEEYIDPKYIESVKMYMDDRNHDFYACLRTINRVYTTYSFYTKEELISYIDDLLKQKNDQ